MATQRELMDRVVIGSRAINQVLNAVPELRDGPAHNALGPAMLVVTLAALSGQLSERMVVMFEEDAALFVLLGLVVGLDA